MKHYYLFKKIKKQIAKKIMTNLEKLKNLFLGKKIITKFRTCGCFDNNCDMGGGVSEIPTEDTCSDCKDTYVKHKEFLSDYTYYDFYGNYTLYKHNFENQFIKEYRICGR